MSEKPRYDRYEREENIVEIVPEPYSLERELLPNGVEYTITFVLRREKSSDTVCVTYERRFGIGKTSNLEFSGGQNLPGDGSVRMHHLRQKAVKAIHTYEESMKKQHFP